MLHELKTKEKEGGERSGKEEELLVNMIKDLQEKEKEENNEITT